MSRIDSAIKTIQKKAVLRLYIQLHEWPKLWQILHDWDNTIITCLIKVLFTEVQFSKYVFSDVFRKDQKKVLIDYGFWFTRLQIKKQSFHPRPWKNIEGRSDCTIWSRKENYSVFLITFTQFYLKKIKVWVYQIDLTKSPIWPTVELFFITAIMTDYHWRLISYTSSSSRRL